MSPFDRAAAEIRSLRAQLAQVTAERDDLQELVVWMHDEPAGDDSEWLRREPAHRVNTVCNALLARRALASTDKGGQGDG